MQRLFKKNYHSAVMLLDYLNDMELCAKYYPPLTFNLKEIINHIQESCLI